MRSGVLVISMSEPASQPGPPTIPRCYPLSRRVIETQTALEHQDALDGDVVLHVPEDDVADPELSLVVPALDEEITVGEFVEWCKEGLAKAGVAGEILIVDSSNDRTAEV